MSTSNGSANIAVCSDGEIPAAPSDPFAHGRQSWYTSAKIPVECTLALVLVVLTAPLVLLAMLAVKLTSRGPIFYTQVRLGLDGKPYSIYKIRSMVQNCEQTSGACWSTQGDPRVTLVGRFLRATHIDELPQLWNILRGEMSLIGPRPERPEFVFNLEKTVHRYRERLSVRPGLTGLAQVQLPPDTDLDSVRLKVSYDLHYIEHLSWWLDFRILCSTVLIVLKLPFQTCETLCALPSRAEIQRAYAGTAETGESTYSDETAASSTATPGPASLPDVLYVVHRLPYPPDKGDRIRAFHLLRFLARRCNVHLACLADEPIPEQSVAMLQRYCAQLEIVSVGRWRRRWRAAGSLALGKSASEGAFANDALRKRICEWAKDIPFHAALASSSSMAPYLRLPALAHTPAVVDLVDLDSQKWFDYASTSRGLQRWFYQLEGTRLRRYERDIASWAHGLTLVSQAEADLYRRCCGDGPVQAVSNGVDLDYFTGSAPRPSSSCVFVGALDYWPNIEGVCWFCHEVWPIIQRARPDACLELVGRQPVAAVQRLGEIAGVRVVGQVPDVRPFLTDAALVIAPLRIARGIQNKVLEAMAMARPTVASPQSLEGLNVVPGHHVIRAAEREEWVTAIIDLLSNPGARQRLGQAGRRFVEQYHCWDSCLAPLEKILRIPGFCASPADLAERLHADVDAFACHT